MELTSAPLSMMMEVRPCLRASIAQASPTGPAPITRTSCTLSSMCRGPSIRDRQPSTQLSCCLVRRLSVERHESPGSAWRSLDLGAPFAGAHAGYLDEVSASVDGLFVAMNVHVCIEETAGDERS